MLNESIIPGAQPGFRSLLFLFLLFSILKPFLRKKRGFLGGSVLKNPPPVQEMQVQSLGREDLPKDEDVQMMVWT